MATLFCGRVRAVLRDWGRFWKRYQERWYDERFEMLSPEQQADALAAVERAKADMTTLNSYFKDTPEGH